MNWKQFRKLHKGEGYSISQLSEMYHAAGYGPYNPASGHRDKAKVPVRKTKVPIKSRSPIRKKSYGAIDKYITQYFSKHPPYKIKSPSSNEVNYNLSEFYRRIWLEYFNIHKDTLSNYAEKKKYI